MDAVVQVPGSHPLVYGSLEDEPSGRVDCFAQKRNMREWDVPLGKETWATSTSMLETKRNERIGYAHTIDE
jgi:hypothetical protein